MKPNTALVARGEAKDKWAVLCQWRSTTGILQDGVTAMSFHLFDSKAAAEGRAAGMRAKFPDVTYTVLPYPEAAKRAGLV